MPCEGTGCKERMEGEERKRARIYQRGATIGPQYSCHGNTINPLATA